ncbi:response regulator transcription factor [Streptomyces sp. S.PB5]|uniref:LuxR C-terminal-related transcriptional regulator n=1 Tax=Streptomyces sp. S.PB5 TaxID=3020844 RepID=UPI0025AED69A|nr:response regulator transcription factor [Streptomyces sp. S.PB5]MDN3024028.1 response regulator transcription factor [Streptomyces sp. S.PB5]
MTSVLIASDQSLQRHGLRMLLAGEPDLTVAGEARSGAEAVRLSAVLRPDVVLLDGRLHETEGAGIIRRITRPAALAVSAEPVGPARVLVLTPTGDEGPAYEALRAGAGGFLPQDATPDELVAAIRVVAAGDSVITPHLTRALIDTVRQLQPALTAPSGVRPATFTDRERDVLVAVASGWSNSEIAEKLSIAPTTVKSHVSHILAKIGARARVQAVTFAYESGLVRPAA